MLRFLKELPIRWVEMWKFIGESIDGDMFAPDPLDGKDGWKPSQLVEKDPFDGIARQ